MLKVVMDTKWWSVSLFAMTRDSDPVTTDNPPVFAVTRRTVGPLRQTLTMHRGLWLSVTMPGVGTKLWHRLMSCAVPWHLSSQCWSSAEIDTRGPGQDKWEHNIISDVMTRVIRRPRDTSEGWPRAVTGDPGLTTAGQCQCHCGHSPQTRSLARCLVSGVCPPSDADTAGSWHPDNPIHPWPIMTQGPGNNVLMRCQHGVNYVVCKQ